MHHIKPGWTFAFRLLCYWLLFFAGFRVWFIAWLYAEWPATSPWPALWNALPLDLSMAGYLLAIPLCLWFAGLAMPASRRAIFSRLITSFHLAVIPVLVLVFGANIFLYEEWHTPLNNRALEYFKTPWTMVDSMSTGFTLGGLITYVTLVWIWWRLYRWLVGTAVFPQGVSPWHLAWLPVQFAFLLLGIRGGLGVMPINESAVYYSPSLFNNHAATNTAWHVLHSMIETRSTENHYRVMDDQEARERTHSLYSRFDTTPVAHDWLQLTENQRPNIVIIIMESMTAQVVEELGGVKGVCPNLSRLASEGLLFDHCYGSGYRTDQGLVSVLGGFPAQPDQSVVLLQDKAAKLPSIPRILKKAGYASAFFYGGEPTFANIGVWLRNQQFEQIISKDDFAKTDITQRWGADDTRLFRKVISTLNQTPQPFFANILTLSLHSPFDVPYTSQWTGDTEAEKFLNSAAFADFAIGGFFDQARSMPWFPNTLFVLVADHGHYNPTGTRMDDPRSRQVPLIITGPLIAPRWRGQRIPTIGNHHDIPATILDELGFSTTPFTWSKDLMQQNAPGFAYYTNENGLGWVSPRGIGFYEFESKTWRDFSGKPDSTDRITARAYLQTLYNDFLGL